VLRFANSINGIATMRAHYLDALFSPRSIAVIGASERERSVGAAVFNNLRDHAFEGEIYAVNPRHAKLQGQPSFPAIDAIGKPVDLAVIATPSSAVPLVLRQCGEAGVRAAVVLSAGFAEVGAEGERLQHEVLATARRYGVRFLGPNCLGIMRPSTGLNATFSKNVARVGNLALLSQSGALCTAILDWAASRQVGFSSVISLGDAADIDFGDVLDYLALDNQTRSILIYVEGIRNARRFMSGLRSAARMKPVVVMKAGRYAEGMRAAVSHTGALVGADDVFSAALERAGVVRVTTIDQWFAAAQVLASGSRSRGERLAIVTNGGGPGVMAADRAVEVGVQLAPLGDATLAQLDAVLPSQWSRHNPIDLLGDAGAPRYGEALKACLGDDSVDGVVVILTPQAMTEPLEVAREVVALAADAGKPVLGCWMGGAQVAAAWQLFAESNLPHFATPEAAVEAFSYLAAYYRNQRLLMQVPGPLADRSEPDVDGARMIIDAALAEHRSTLSEVESKAVLRAFGIPTVASVLARSATEALVIAETLGFPVAMKILSPQIVHKSDVGGVRLNVGDARSVKRVYRELLEQVRAVQPQAQIEGVVVEQMAARAQGRELMAGVARDAVFGPVVSFGIGGVAVEVTGDRAVALPPLNGVIINSLIAKTRAAKLMEGFRHWPAVNRPAVEHVLRRISEMLCELPSIQEMDINPLIADQQGALAVDARIVVAVGHPNVGRYDHLAIHPYPTDLVTHWQAPDGSDVVLRPIRPEDADIEQNFVRELSPQAKYFRFMHAVQELTPLMLVRFTQIDYDREMAFIAVTDTDGTEREIGVARYTLRPNGDACEFAIVVADQWRGRGLGTRLMSVLMECAKARGIRLMEGEVLAENANMLRLMQRLGFAVRPHEEEVHVCMVTKLL
jgi:acetyltransferase